MIAHRHLWILALLAWAGTPLPADEGMWLFNHPPRRLLQERHGFQAGDAWLERLQRSCVRFNSGGSGAFVSEDGLVMSNHHVGADALAKFGDAAHDYLRDGFHARTRDEEKRCHDLELNVLMSIEDVTDRVNAAVGPGDSAAAAFRARSEAIAAIEKESLDRTGLRSDVVTLYQGGQYHLYRSKRYTDVRLVFAPEQQIAFFGGDPDNFEYPRHDLDICFFRVYEDGRPARTRDFVRWSASGAAEGELVFVAGHPGHTDRGLTVAELASLREWDYAYLLQWLCYREVNLAAWSAREEENARIARDDLLGVQNRRKARLGGLAGLLDPALFPGREVDEARLRAAILGHFELRGADAAWDRIAAAQHAIDAHALRYRLLEAAHGFRSSLFEIARTLLRAAEEREKPDGGRLSEFREASRESLELELFSARPIYDEYEIELLAQGLTWLAMRAGAGDPLVRKALAGQPPRGRAAELVRGTKVKEIEVRRRLYDGGKAAMHAARDPMIEFARLVDAEARAARDAIDVQNEIQAQAHARIAQARLALEGASQYPDATFTLRLAFGVVKGYSEDGRSVPFQTTMGGLYERWASHQGRPPYDLPQRWIDQRSRLSPPTPLNFVSTADIIGGNSGSPVVNRQGELVGIIFDGNIQSLVLDYQYTEEKARAVAVHSQGIIEALRRVYGADSLADELIRGSRAR